ncbi:MAG: hypothetical protein AAF598_09795 [Bacteroidota bacterium]
MDTLLLLRLLLDFGCLVMIWMVQLVVYPSFIYFAKADLFRWHERYTGLVTVVVFPLMTGQLFVFGVQLWQLVNWYTLLSGMLIAGLWGSTFLYFVPLHGTIQPDHYDLNKVKRLANHNWWRTALWSILFLFTLAFYLSQQA